MKDRFITFALAIAALVLFYVLMLHPAAPTATVTHPITDERGPNGYYGLFHWLQTQGIKVVSFRERFEGLQDKKNGPSTGNLMITTMPHRYPVRPSEKGNLRDWIERGNTLVILAALTDTPDWSIGEGVDPELPKHLEEISGLTFRGIPLERPGARKGTEAKGKPGAASPAKPRTPPTRTPEKKEPEKKESVRDRASDATSDALDDLQETLGTQERELVPNGKHPLFNGVTSVQAISEFPGSNWEAYEADASLVLNLAHNPKSDKPVMWLAQLGSGRVLVFAYGSLFTNKVLGQKDNAHLLANVIAYGRDPNGVVLIDDAHQGVASFYDPQTFFRDARLHNSLWWLLGLWFVFVLGTQPLRAKLARWTPVDITDFIRATGGFMARVLRPAAAAERLFQNFFNDVRRHVGLQQNGAPIWEWLATQSVVPVRDLEALTSMHRSVLRRGPVDLVQLQNLLTTTQKNLL